MTDERCVLNRAYQPRGLYHAAIISSDEVFLELGQPIFIHGKYRLRVLTADRTLKESTTDHVFCDDAAFRSVSVNHAHDAVSVRA